jgi:hypothetical protein
MLRSASAYTVPRAITNSTRSLASPVMMSSVRPSAMRPRSDASAAGSENGSTATEARCRLGAAPRRAAM